MNLGELSQMAMDYSGSREVRAAINAINDTRMRLARIGSQTVNTTTITIPAPATSFQLGSDWGITSLLNLRGIAYTGVGAPFTVDLEEEPVTSVIAWQSGESLGISRFYAVDGATTVYLYPLPEANSTLTIRWVPIPSGLEKESDVPSELNEAFHSLIAIGAARDLAIRENLERALFLERRFAEGEREFREWVAGRKSSKTRRLRVGPVARRFRVSHDRSQDVESL